MAADTTGARAPEERRRRILDATVEVIRERGFAGTRVADIAATAGTSSGLVLYHFGSLATALTEALTYAEDRYYAEVEAGLATTPDPVDRLRLMAELAATGAPIAGDWSLWLELWVRALRDEDARAVRESLDRRWRAVLRQVVVEGAAAGVFHPLDVAATTLRLSSLMDGLAIQLALGEPGMTAAKFKRLWLDAAALELGVPAQAFRGRGPRVVRRRAAS